MIREARPDEAGVLAEIQRDASLAALAHIFPPERYPFPIRARRFYERHGWQKNGRTRVVPFPPNPLDVGYTIDLESRMAGR